MNPIDRLKSMPLWYKFHLGLALYITSIIILGTISYTDLVKIDQRIVTLTQIDRLTSEILEARRYEKNYFLYMNPGDLIQTKDYASRTVALINDLIRVEHREYRRLNELRAMVNEYRRRLNMLSEVDVIGLEDDQLRSTGKAMIDLAEQLTRDERSRIHNLLGFLEFQLLLSVAGAIILGLGGAYFLFGRLFNALSVMEEATRKIGRGRFERLHEHPQQEEIRRITRAFNNMMDELESRQEQLIQARKLSSLGTLTAGIAHQLNNPLNNISTSCQIAREELETLGDKAPEYLRKMLKNIDQETNRSREIVQGLLEYTRQRSFAPRRIRLEELVDKTVRLVSSQIPPGIVLEKSIPPGLTLSLDMQRMQEALLNILINAIQAIASEQGVIAIQARELEDGYAELIVRDTGTGIPPDQLEHIFDPFYTTKKDTGTGLGLSIVYGIIERHGGSIRVESTVGRGTSFIIRLPLLDERAEASSSAHE